MATASETVRFAAGRPQIPVPWAAPAARDRLSSTLFLAALFHGILILGVTFSGSLVDQSGQPTSLDVVIVTDNSPESKPPDEARVIAQRSLRGRGNTELDQQLSTALAQAPTLADPGPDRPGELDADAPGSRRLESRPLVQSVRPSGVVVKTEPGDPADPAVQRRSALPGADRPTEVVDDPAVETLISEAGERELVVSASTRESRIAAYLSDWKRRVERVGTLNFPRQASTIGLTGHPTLEVVITADGSLREVIVRRSSGEILLDEAAVEILQIAAPFAPFPDFLRTDYDVLRFAYEWHFSRGGDPRARVLAVGGGP
jgi:protein TonB